VDPVRRLDLRGETSCSCADGLNRRRTTTTTPLLTFTGSELPIAGGGGRKSDRDGGGTEGTTSASFVGEPRTSGLRAHPRTEYDSEIQSKIGAPAVLEGGTSLFFIRAARRSLYT